MTACSDNMRKLCTNGFTLVEVVVAITLSAIVIGFMAMFMTAPIDSYAAQVRRAGLTDSADAISRNLGNDLAAAVPNSVRIANNGNFRLIEMLAADGEAARYRTVSVPPNTNLTLDPGVPDALFTTIGQFRPNLNVPLNLPNYRVLVAAPVTNLYTTAGVMSPPGLQLTPLPLPAQDEASVQLATPFVFSTPSPTTRVFLVSGTVAYICDLTARTLTRYSGFPVAPAAAAHSNPVVLAGLSTASELIATNITACIFRPLVRTTGARTLTSYQVTVTRDREVLRIFDQVAQTLGP